ncbi:hypothetical protein [Actinomyces succiniciruminis]|uniref:Uncharacterized protein n=1 Tax=Actinomyces succiniciruminis TaxID=1522002 RepID=A0A1L7RG71_9ACTO|nr:hypothetical protein [Actinomyces succiniciruminis]CED90376.1 Hypothetical protein AAM4_0481 [Actinomyces succiniciruminis]
MNRHSTQGLLAQLAGIVIVTTPLSACSGGGTALPDTTPVPVETVLTQTANANGVALQLPSTWVTHSHAEDMTDDGTDDDPWALHMTDPDGDAEPVLAISDALPTTSAEQAYQAGSALLSSSITGYQPTGAFTFPESINSAEPQDPGTPGAEATPEEDAATSAPTIDQASTIAGTIARITFTYERADADASGAAWIVPGSGGYIVVVLLADDDAIRAAVEASLTEDDA